MARPQPPSRLGRGNFPERELARAAEAEQYYPGLPSIATIGETSLILFTVSRCVIINNYI